MNISVSIDGTWQKRGHQSHNGVVTVIETMTGLVIDFVALSNYCRACESGLKPDAPDYEGWMAIHRPTCQKNINCSSNAMEMEGAVTLFQRSIQLHRFRYTLMLGDGDSKTHTKLLEVNPYDGWEIEKLECTSRVSKWMGTALRNLVAKKKAQGQPIGGRGKLTELRIKELTNYYGSAIKNNQGDTVAMRTCLLYTSDAADES